MSTRILNLLHYTLLTLIFSALGWFYLVFLFVYRAKCFMFCYRLSTNIHKDKVGSICCHLVALYWLYWRVTNIATKEYDIIHTPTSDSRK